ncbi:MAG: transposase [Flammeovirgaceae bacterium]|nr:transposase [Flammeovirgaceae bacterium]
MKSKTLQKHYKHQISGYHEWEQKQHAEDYLIFPENISDSISIDEVSLSKGELYTIVTNKNTGCKNKKSVIAIINGTEAKTIEKVLLKIPLESRNKVKEISLDMAPNMALASRNCFAKSSLVIDRFHVVRLVCDAMQHLRTQLRWKVIDEENEAIKKAKEQGLKYKAEILSNGDTLRELLVRSKYLLYKYEDDWTINQKKRAELIFSKYPQLEQAYKLCISFRNIYKCLTKQSATDKFIEWKNKVLELNIKEFNSVVNSIEHHYDNIMNFFNNRITNANAESFNSKIKNFRANLRGVTDIKFFLFRLYKLFA